MRLAFVSPLPPSPTGVAEYSASIVGELRRRDFVDASESMSALKLQDYDVRLYQVGNNRLHDGAYEAALRVLTLRPELRLAMGELARQHVLREHSLDKVGEHYRKLWS